MPLGLEALGLDQDRPADVVADVLELAGSADRAHGLILTGRNGLPDGTSDS